MSLFPAEIAMATGEISSKKNSQGQTEKKNDCRVQVAVRVRPFVSKELVDSESSCVKTTNNKITMGSDKEFDFDRVIDQESTQEQVYQWCMKDLLTKALEGYNATILAYGQTGSGKTYTMGTSNISINDASEMGIIPRVIRELFQIRSESEKQTEMVLKISYFEIYNDNIIDLLDPNAITGSTQAGGKKSKGTNAAQNVYIREELDGSINLYGITEEKVNSPEEMLAALERGGMCRSTSATLMNQTSSRSHAVFTIFLEQHGIEDLYLTNPMEEEGKQIEGLGQKGEETSGFKTSKLHFVDLAGSERIKKTGAIGNTLKEGININMGLLSLGNVISALTEPSKGGGKKHIPYRDSKLTRILQDSLGGNSNTLMVACVSPAESNFEESLNTLKYASRARRIKNKPVVNRDPQSALISSLKQQLQESHVEICKLRSLLSQHNIQIPNESGERNALKDDSYIRKFSQDLLKYNQGGTVNTILSASTEAEAEELKNLRLAQVRLERRIKELAAENSEMKSRSYKEEIDALQMQRERDECRLKLEKMMKLGKEKGLFGGSEIKKMEMEIEGNERKIGSQSIESKQIDVDFNDISIDLEQKSLVDEYCNQIEKLKKEMQEKERSFKELQGEFEDGIKASLRDQQMLVEREKKIAVINRNLKKAESELKKAKEETKRSKLFEDSKQQGNIVQSEETEDEPDEDYEAEQLEKIAEDEEIVQMESQLKLDENQKKLKLSKVDGSINERSEKMRQLNQDQLLLQQQLLSKMKEQYHSKINNLEHEMKKVESQRDEALQKIVSSNTKEAIEQKQKVIDSFKTKVQEMQFALGDYKKKAKEQETLLKTVQAQEKQISSLGNEINKFKNLKTSLYKEMKKNNEEFEKFKMQKYKDIMVEKKKNVEKEKQIFKLKNQTRVQERLLFKKQEDIKKLIRSRDLIKKIIATSSVNKKNKFPSKKESSLLNPIPKPEDEIDEETALEDCLASLVESIEVESAVSKLEVELNKTHEELEEVQLKQIEQNIMIEKQEQELFEKRNKKEDVEEEELEIEQQKRQLTEMQSRLESLDSKYEFQKIKLNELQCVDQLEKFDHLQSMLLTSSRFNSLAAQKALLKGLMERFGASTLELMKAQEQLEQQQVQLENAQQYIELLENQKQICNLEIEQLQEQIKQFQSFDSRSPDQSYQENNYSLSILPSNKALANLSSIQNPQDFFTNQLQETNSSNKQTLSRLKHKRSMSDIDINMQTKKQPILKKDYQFNEEILKIKDKYINDQSKQIKQYEIYIKRLQNRIDTIQQKNEDLQRANKKDKQGSATKNMSDEQESNIFQNTNQTVAAQDNQAIKALQNVTTRLRVISSFKEKRKEAKTQMQNIALNNNNLGSQNQTGEEGQNNSLKSQQVFDQIINTIQNSSNKEKHFRNSDDSTNINSLISLLNAQEKMRPNSVSEFPLPDSSISELKQNLFEDSMKVGGNSSFGEMDQDFKLNEKTQNINQGSELIQEKQRRKSVFELMPDYLNQTNNFFKYEKVGKISDAHTGQVFCVKNHENFLFSTSIKTLKIWDVESLKCVSEIAAHTSFVKGLTIQNEGKWLATSGDKTINIWDMSSLQKICTLNGKNTEIKQLYSKGGNELYSVGKGSSGTGALVIWDIRKQQVIQEREKNQDILSVLPHNNMIYYSSRDHYVRRIDQNPSQNGVESYNPPHFDAVTSLAELNGYLVSGSKDHNLKLWNTQVSCTAAEQHYYYSNEQILCLEPNHDNSLLYVGQKDGKIKTFITLNEKLKDIGDISNGLSSINSISSIKFGSVTNMLVCGSSDKVIQIWKPTSDSINSIEQLKNQNTNKQD